MIKYAIVSAEKGIYLGDASEETHWSRLGASSEIESAPVFATEEEARGLAVGWNVEGASDTYAVHPVEVGRRASYATAEQLFDAGLRLHLGHLADFIRLRTMWERVRTDYRQQLAPATVADFLSRRAEYVDVGRDLDTWYAGSLGTGKSFDRLEEAFEFAQEIVDESYETMETNMAESLGFEPEHWRLFIVGDRISVICRDDSRVSVNTYAPGYAWTVDFEDGGPEGIARLNTLYDFDNALEYAEGVVDALHEGRDVTPGF